MVAKFILKTDENGIPQTSPEGHPVYVNAETKTEEAFDVNELYGKIIELGKEAKKRRETNRTLNETLRQMSEEAGVSVEELPNLISKVKDVQAEKPKVQGEIEAIRKQWADEKTQLEGKLREKERFIEKSSIMSTFAQSPHFTGTNAKTILSPAVAYKVFGERFKMDTEEQRVIAVDNKGEPVYSRKNPELLASFEEAMEMFLQEDMYKDLIKFNGAPGSGSVPGASSKSINTQNSQIALATQEAMKTGVVSGLIKAKI